MVVPMAEADTARIIMRRRAAGSRSLKVAGIVCCSSRMAGIGVRPLTIVLLLVCGTSADAFAQQQPSRIASGDAAISGRVIDRESKRPIEGALVKLSVLSPQNVVLVAATGLDGS